MTGQFTAEERGKASSVVTSGDVWKRDGITRWSSGFVLTLQ